LRRTLVRSYRYSAKLKSRKEKRNANSQKLKAPH